MTINIHVKRGIQFKPQLNTQDRSAWISEVANKLEERALNLNVGKSSLVINSENLKEFHSTYENAPQDFIQKYKIDPSINLDAFMADFYELLDDLVKDSTVVPEVHTPTGTLVSQFVDVSTQSELSKVLGLDSDSVTYADNTSEFHANMSNNNNNTFSVLGVQLSTVASTQTVDPLEGQVFISSDTFLSPPRNLARNSTEFEVVRRMGGLSAKEVLRLARTEIEPAQNGEDAKTALRKIRKPKYAEALTMGQLGYDEMDWGSKAHEVRESIPYINLMIEESKLEFEDGEHKVSVGTDYFSDTYYKAKDFNNPNGDLLTDNDIILRSRVRMGTPGNATRLLVQTKIKEEQHGIADNGMKSVHKLDERVDAHWGGDEYTSSFNLDDIEALTHKVMAGEDHRPENSPNRGMLDSSKPVSYLYHELKERNLLSDVGPHEDVLKLEIGSHVFSERGRIHFDEVGNNTTRRFYSHGESILDDLKEIIQTSTTLESSTQTDLLDQLTKIQDHELLLEKVAAKLVAFDPSMGDPSLLTTQDLEKFLPNSSNRSSFTPIDLKKAEIVAEANKEIYDDFSDKFDDLRREISGVRLLNGNDDQMADAMDFADEFVDFFNALPQNDGLRKKTTIGPILEYLDSVIAGTDIITLEEMIKQFGEHIKNEDNGALQNATLAEAQEMLKGLRKNLVAEHLNIMDRQLKEVGSAGKTLWMNKVKKQLGSIEPSDGNLLIDTFDFVQDISPKDWATLTTEQKMGVEEIPADKIYNADLISEVQVELGLEKSYTDALQGAQNTVSSRKLVILITYLLSEEGINSKHGMLDFFNDTFLSTSESEQNVFIEKLNKHASEKGSLVQIESLNEFKEMMTLVKEGTLSVFFGSRINAQDDQMAVLEAELLQSAFDALRGAQDQISMFRDTRIQKYAEEAGFDDVTWEAASMSKGEKSLKILSGEISVD